MSKPCMFGWAVLGAQHSWNVVLTTRLNYTQRIQAYSFDSGQAEVADGQRDHCCSNQVNLAFYHIHVSLKPQKPATLAADFDLPPNS